MKYIYKLINYLFPFGIIAVLCFIAHDVLGSLLWSGYNPVTNYVSELTADGAPNVLMTRSLLYGYMIGQVIFFAGMLVEAFYSNGVILRIGYSGLLIAALISAFGFGLFPMTMDFIINYKNYVHLAVTIIILADTVSMLFLLAIGYFRWKNYRKIGYALLAVAILFLSLNLLHLYLILNGSPVLGLVQRLTFYSFESYVFILSWFCMTRSHRTELESTAQRDLANKNFRKY